MVGKKLAYLKAGLDTKSRMEIEVEVRQIETWIESCPLRCVAGKLLENYIKLFNHVECLEDYIKHLQER